LDIDPKTIGAHYLQEAVAALHKYKGLADAAAAQVSDDQFFAVLDGEGNSIALLMRHMAGNMRSRWTDFLTTDGEKPDRARDTEFEVPPGTGRREVVRSWEDGWTCALDSLQSLRPEDLLRTVRIRGEPHTVLQAISRHVTHSAYHVGQIVLLAKHHAADRWHTLSIPRGKSEEYNAGMISTPE
jgi:uncharacterized damage-inducible protein DinB